MKTRDWIIVVAISLVMAASVFSDTGPLRQPARRAWRAITRVVDVLRLWRNEKQDCEMVKAERNHVSPEHTDNAMPVRSETPSGNVALDHGYGW